MRSIWVHGKEAHFLNMRFVDRNLEASYHEFHVSKYLWQLRLAHVLAMLFFAVALLAERFIIENPGISISFRLILVEISFSLGLISSFLFQDFYKTNYQWVNAYYVLITSFCFIVPGSMTNMWENSLILYSALFVCLVFNYTFIRQDFFKASLTGFLVWLGFIFAAYFNKEATPQVNLIAVFLSVIHLLGMFISYSIEYDGRRNFLMMLQIQDDARHIEEVNENLERRIDERTEELRIAKEQAEESDRLKTAFLANMSHEIRTPMNGILGFLELMKNTDVSEKDKADYIRLMNKSGKRLLMTINDIIEISRIESGEVVMCLEDFNVNETLDYLKEVYTQEAESKGVRLAIDKPEMELFLRSDSHKLESILSNLIRNALKFTEQGEVRFGYKLEGEKLYFYVKDTGRGIPPDKLEVIFDRFVQADSTIDRGYEGSGLGLPISKAFAEMLQAELWVESEPGKGSKFSFAMKANNILITD